MLSPASYPAQEYESAWRNVVFYDEHTWGAHNSIEEPDLPFVRQQWEFKQKFALEADRESRTLLAKALHEPTESAQSKTTIDVYNTESWPRTDVVFLPPGLSAAGDRVVDSDGHAVPAQRLSTGELAVLAENIPPFSAARFSVEKGTAFAKKGAKVQGNTLENDFLVLSVNPRTGAIDSLRRKKNGVQLADRTRGDGLNQYLYVLGTDPAKAQGISNVRVRVKERGSLVASLLVEADAPGAKRYSSEIRLIAGINRVDLITNIDKQSVRDKEGVHIAFPFAVPGGQLRYDVADGVVRPEADQLAGACKNFFSVENWADISNPDYGVTWATANAPLIEIGAITAEQPWMKSIQPSSVIYSYVMNNYWHTNYKADQEGPVTFSYSILPHSAFSVADAVKFGIDRRQPLLAAIADLSRPVPLPLVRVSSPEVVVASLKPIAAGRGWLAYVYNPTAKAQRVSFESGDGTPMTLRSSDPNGHVHAEDKIPDFEIAAFGSAFVAISRKGSSDAAQR